jgi:hypothetical protein
VGLGAIGLEPERLAETVGGLGEVPLLGQCLAQVEMRFGIERSQRQRLPIAGDGLLPLTEPG